MQLNSGCLFQSRSIIRVETEIGPISINICHPVSMPDLSISLSSLGPRHMKGPLNLKEPHNMQRPLNIKGPLYKNPPPQKKKPT